jgi:hypothetical protein
MYFEWPMPPHAMDTNICVDILGRLEREDFNLMTFPGKVVRPSGCVDALGARQVTNSHVPTGTRAGFCAHLEENTGTVNEPKILPFAILRPIIAIPRDCEDPP